MLYLGKMGETEQVIGADMGGVGRRWGAHKVIARPRVKVKHSDP